MRDHRIDALARVLVGYSTQVRKGDVVAIEGNSPAAEPLLLAGDEEVLRAGGLPIGTMQRSGQQDRVFALASDEQLDWVSQVNAVNAEKADVRISVDAPG